MGGDVYVGKGQGATRSRAASVRKLSSPLMAPPPLPPDDVSGTVNHSASTRTDVLDGGSYQLGARPSPYRGAAAPALVKQPRSASRNPEYSTGGLGVARD